MTQEKAIKMMKARLKCLECDTNGTSENCEECYLNYEQGMLREQIEWMKVAVKTMEQQPMLDKIRAEIETQDRWLAQAGYNAYNVDIAFKAIKLTLAESEVEE